MLLSAVEAYRIWAPQYDAAVNPLLALESRLVANRIEGTPGHSLLDVGSGTGRWMAWACVRGVRVFGIDLCPEMLAEAARKPALAGRSAQADLRSIPMRDNAVDTVICSFTLGYLPSIRPAMQELARVGRRVIVSDLHPAAVRAGWTRSFRAADEVHQIAHYEHSVAALDAAAGVARLLPAWRVEACFGEPERELFCRAGKESEFEKATQVPAVLVTAWNKSSD